MRFRILILTVILVSVGIFVYSSKPRKTISPIQERPMTKILGVFSVKKDPETLKKNVQKVIGDSWKNYSVLVTDLNSSFSMGINEHEIFTAASVNKIPIMAALYNQEQNGKVKMDNIITLQPDDIQDYGTGSIRYDPPGSTYSVKTLVRLMMQKSDNTAAFLLGNYVVGIDTVQKFMIDWGLSQTDVANNKTSNADMALLLTKIYRNNVANPTNTVEMLGFLKDSDFEDRLPAGLPKDAVIYHKVGSGETGEIHDVGIVVHGKTVYYIGILTTNISDEAEAVKLEATISKIVYDFMN